MLEPFTSKFVNVNVVLGQCFSGGFNDNLKKVGCVVASASTGSESSFACSDIPYDEFVYQWTCAVNEATHRKVYVKSDADNNGRVTMEEAFIYAKDNDRVSAEHPMYTSTPISVGEDLAFTHLAPAVDLYMKDKMPIVRIFLPKDATVEQIKGKVTAGDIKISDLNAKNIDLAVKSGNISIENALLRGSISTESGSINLNKSEIGETKLATISGNINIAESKLADKLDFSTQTGDIIVASENKVEDYNVTAKINLGKFILGNISYKNIKDGYKSESKGKYDISMRTKIGDIIFNKGEGAVLDNDEYITNQTGKEDEEKDSESEDEGTKEDQDKTTDDNELIESDSKEDTTDESSDENGYDTDSESEENQDETYDEDVSDSEEESSDY